MRRILFACALACALSPAVLAGDSHTPGLEDPPCTENCPDSSQTSAAPSGFEWVLVEGAYVLVSIIG